MRVLGNGIIELVRWYLFGVRDVEDGVLVCFDAGISFNLDDTASQSHLQVLLICLSDLNSSTQINYLSTLSLGEDRRGGAGQTLVVSPSSTTSIL